MLSPAALSILMSTFPQGTPRTHALAAWGAVGGAGAAVGVLLGGVLTELLGWQAIFLINLPVGLALAVAARTDRSPPTRAARSGAGSTCAARSLATGSLGAIVFALSQAADAGWTSRRPSSSAPPASPVWSPSPLVELRTRPAAAAHRAPRRPRRRRRLRDDARRRRRAVRHLPAHLAVHAERARHRRRW